MKKKIAIAIVAIALLLSSINTTGARAAIREMEIDYDEYSLWVDEVPDGIWDSGYIAAKLTKTNLDPDNYMIAMIDDVDSMNKLHKAMNAAGISPKSNRSFAMNVILYEYDEEEGDYYASSDSDFEVVCPIADDMYQYDEEDEPYLKTSFLKLVNVNSSGKLTYPSFELVSVDDIICAKFKVSSNGVYGFLLNGVAPTPSEEEGTTAPTMEPTKVPTKAPTTAPTKAPSTAPTKAMNPTTVPIPTKIVNVPQSASGEKDQTPKTGDEHNSLWLLLMGTASFVTLAGVVILWKRENRKESD